MDAFEKKSFTVARGYTYSYYISPSTQNVDPNAPTLFFCHGWPDDAHLWQFVAPHLLPLKFRILIPDLLGVGGSSKPKHLSAYNYSYFTKDFVEIFDHEKVSKVISIGHDWGSAVAQRVYLYAPERVAGLIMLNVAYMAPSDQPFDLDAFNEMTAKVYGYSIFTYWYFFTSEEGTRLMSEKPEKVWEICHGADQDGSWIKKMFSDKNAMRDLILDPKPAPLKEYAQNEKLKKHFVDRVKRDGMETWQTYYRAWRENVQYEAEKVGVPKDRYKINLPVLYIACSGDPIARPDTINGAKDAGLLPDLEEVLIDSGHWCTYERPEEVTNAIKGFLEKRF